MSHPFLASTCGQAARPTSLPCPRRAREHAGQGRCNARGKRHGARRGRIWHGGDGGGRDQGPDGRFGAWTGRAVGSWMSPARTAAGAKTTGPSWPTPPAPAIRSPSLTPPLPLHLHSPPLFPSHLVAVLGVSPLTSRLSPLKPHSLLWASHAERGERGAAEGCLRREASRPGTASASLLLLRTRSMYTWRRGRRGGGEAKRGTSVRTRVALFLAFDMAFSSSCCSRDPALPFPGSPLLTARRHADAGCMCQDEARGACDVAASSHEASSTVRRC